MQIYIKQFSVIQCKLFQNNIVNFLFHFLEALREVRVGKQHVPADRDVTLALLKLLKAELRGSKASKGSSMEANTAAEMFRDDHCLGQQACRAYTSACIGGHKKTQENGVTIYLLTLNKITIGSVGGND